MSRILKDLRDLSKSYLLERQRFLKESDDVKPLISAEQVSWEPADLDYTNQQEELFREIRFSLLGEKWDGIFSIN